MDDVIIPSQGFEEGLAKLKDVLQVASRNGLRINWSKCQILHSKVQFLGYIIQSETITPGPEKIQAVKEFPTPHDKKAIKRFLGLTSYFRKVIHGYASIARPLSDLLRGDSKYELGEKQQIAFEKLKTALISEPVLKLYNPNLQTEIHTDASKYGFGAVLLQKDPVDSAFHPVQYMSRKTSPFEEKYDSYELEVYWLLLEL